ncbi:MAG: FtsX-like permease family protein [Candidatus Lokiarchaeota archaeon]|nr:FtsX-like permease family protein [Candidatus Lokiarchaeota archaeon]
MGFQKHTNLASYALGNLFKYRLRSTAIVVALIVSTTLLCSTEFIHQGVLTDIENSLEEGPDIVVQQLEAGRQKSIPLSWFSNISQVSGVKVAMPRVWGYADVGSGRFLTVMGINVTDYQDIPGATGTEIEEGEFIQTGNERSIVIGQGIVDLMNTASNPVEIEVGSVISLISYNQSLIEFTVAGIFGSKSKIYSYDMIMTDIQSARELFGISNETCTDIAIWNTPGAYLNDVAFRIENRLVDARVLSREAIHNAMLRTYGDRAGIVALIWTILLLTVLLLAFTVSSAGSDEARREVGLLKALGFDTVDVLEIRMIESLTQSLLGSSFGISISIIYTFLLGAPGLAGLLLGWNLVLLNGGIPLTISSITIFVIYTVAIIPILVATVIPAWRNALTDPDVVLRGI